MKPSKDGGKPKGFTARDNAPCTPSGRTTQRKVGTVTEYDPRGRKVRDIELTEIDWSAFGPSTPPSPQSAATAARLQALADGEMILDGNTRIAAAIKIYRRKAR